MGKEKEVNEFTTSDGKKIYPLNDFAVRNYFAPRVDDEMPPAAISPDFLLKEPVVKDTIVATNDSKWYNLYIVSPGGGYRVLEFYEIDNQMSTEDYEKLGSAYLDHAPNPLAVCLYADKNDMHVCSYSLGTITRRWYNEYYTLCPPLNHSNNNEI